MLRGHRAGTSAAEARSIPAAGCPAVVLEPSFRDPAMAGSRYMFHEIWTDSPAIARLAADHLFELGLKRFAYCGFADDCPWSEVRQQVFVSHLEARGFACSVFPAPGRGISLLASVKVGALKIADFGINMSVWRETLRLDADNDLFWALFLTVGGA